MEYLIIYDNVGMIVFIGNLPNEPVGIPHMRVKMPDGKHIVSIDTSATPHKPIFEDIPKSEMELLQERVAELELQNQAIISGASQVVEV